MALFPRSQAPVFGTVVCGNARTLIKEQIVALEAANMKEFERNGPKFEKYLGKCDLMLHTVMTTKDVLLGFAISGNEGRCSNSKVFVYELHVAAAHRRCGLAKALLDLCEKSSMTRGRSSPTLELQVHKGNSNAISFYEHMGFACMSPDSNGNMFVMQRKR